MHPPGSRTWPTRQLAAFVILANLAIFIPNVAYFIGINFTEHHIKNFINESAETVFELELSENEVQLGFGLVASIPMVTAIPGTLAGRYSADRWGRKLTIFWGAASLQILASIITTAAYYATNVIVFYLGRAVYGLAFGILVGIMNLYVSECTPATHRGMIGNMATVIINCCTILNHALTLPQFFGSADRWHLLYVATIPISFLAIALSYYLPDSPKFDYIQRKRPDLAAKTIRRYHGPSEDVADIFAHYEQEREQASHSVTLKEIWSTPHLRVAMTISMLIGSTRVTSGILLLAVFSRSIYRDQLGMDPDHANYCILGVAVATTFAALWGAFQIDKYGRRVMFLGSSLIMLVLTVLFILFSWLGKHHVPWMRYLGLICIMAVFLIFNVAPNTLQFFFLTEIVPQTARATVSTVSLISSLIIRIVYFSIFLVVQKELGEFSLAPLVILPTVPTLWYLYYRMPETKNRTVHEVVEEMIRKYSTPPAGGLLEPLPDQALLEGKTLTVPNGTDGNVANGVHEMVPLVESNQRTETI